MTRFEGYLIRLKNGYRKVRNTEGLRIVEVIHGTYILLRNEPDLSKAEMEELQNELKEIANERREDRSRN